MIIFLGFRRNLEDYRAFIFPVQKGDGEPILTLVGVQ